MKPTLEEGTRLLCIDEYNAENKEIKFDVDNYKLLADYGDGTGYHDVGGLGNSLARVSLSLTAVSWEVNSDAETSTTYPYKITVNQSVGNKFRKNFASGEISIIPSLTLAQQVAGYIAFVEANSIVYNDASDVATLQFTVYSKNNSAPASDIDFKAVLVVDSDFDESVFNDNQGQ